MEIEAVIFDLDGTLIDLSLRIQDAKKEFIERIRGMGLELGAIDERRPAEIIITYLERFRGVPRERSRRILEECFEPYELEAVERAKPRDGGIHVLGRLREAGFKLGLASNNSRRCAERVLGRLGLQRSFNTIVTRDDVSRLKPHEEVVIKALKKLETAPWKAIYVGDSVVDVIAGKRAGVHVAAITGGADSEERLHRSGADYVINGFEEIFEVIRLIDGRTF